MRRSAPALAVTLAVAAALATLVGRVVHAQTATSAMTPLQNAIACAPPPSNDGPPDNALHVVGSQDPEARALFGARDLLVLDGGTAAGVQLGQQFFVRRSNAFFGSTGGLQETGSRTVGWIRVVAVNESTAIATVDHACGGIIQMDYLEPFVEPVVPKGADRDEAPGEPDFSSLGRILGGNENRQIAGTGDFVLIDRGRDHGVVPGMRFAIYRDLGVAGMPLTTIGEAVMITIGRTMAVGRITRARDAARAGDYVAERK
jgi:hypothetical protein